MRIVIICEGKTEQAFKPCLVEFLKSRFLELQLDTKMPKLVFDVHNGPIPKEDKLSRVVTNLLNAKLNPADAVIALADVYPDFVDAQDAKSKMRQWVGKQPAFFPHVALHDFEAWLLPYWDQIRKLSKQLNAAPFGSNPETVNHHNPPAHRMRRLFEAGKCRDSYDKPRDAGRILKDADLMVAIKKCPELKAFVNTILKLCDPTTVIPEH